MTTRELGYPFRRDAMKLPQRHLSKYSRTNEEFESLAGNTIKAVANQLVAPEDEPTIEYGLVQDERRLMELHYQF